MPEVRDAVVQDLPLLHLPVCQGDVLRAESTEYESQEQVIMSPCNVLKLQPLRNVESQGDEETRENKGHHMEH